MWCVEKRTAFLFCRLDFLFLFVLFCFVFRQSVGTVLIFSICGSTFFKAFSHASFLIVFAWCMNLIWLYAFLVDYTWSLCVKKKKQGELRWVLAALKVVSWNNQSFDHLHIEGFGPEWCILTIYHCKEIPFWLETLELWCVAGPSTVQTVVSVMLRMKVWLGVDIILLTLTLAACIISDWRQ